MKAGLANIVGGCCGTSRNILNVCRKSCEISAQAKPVVEPYLRLSGLEAVTLTSETNFVNIGERTNITGSPKFSKLILAEDYEAALTVARQQ